MPHQQMKLLLSSDAKPRLKWTAELHHRFVHAVNQLGGPHKATPKSLMRIMGIQGLTLYHLKSHLQKYRLGRSHPNKQQGSVENESSNSTCNAEEDQINDAQALEMQRKLEQQIEVQRHLQLRIEAQGRYLQSVLKKAQETLSRYSACAMEVASMVDSGCTTSSLTEEKLLGCSFSGGGGGGRKNNNDDDDDDNGKSAEDWSVKKNIDLNELDSGPTGIDLNSNALQLFGSTY